MSDEKAAQLEWLINKGKFGKAARMAVTLDRGSESAAFYFNAALAEQLYAFGSAVGVSRYRAKARLAEDYMPLMEVDFVRDQALAFLRKGMPNKARAFARTSLGTLHELEGTVDPAEFYNRLAAHAMLMGRISLALGEAKEAEALHRGADQQFRGLGNNANKQWELNNGFHWLRAAAAAGEHVNWRFAQFNWVIDKDPSRTRRLRAHLLMQFGRAAYRLDERLMRLRFTA